MGDDGEFDLHDSTGKFLVDDDGGWQVCGYCCAPDDCPCSLADWRDLYYGVTDECNGLVRQYRIADYEDGDIPTCETCDDSSDPPWDGTFYAWVWGEDPYSDRDDRCVWWSRQGGGTPPPRSISGKVFATSRLWLAYKTSWRDPYWRVDINCIRNGSQEYPVLVGRKFTGQTPRGKHLVYSSCTPGLTSFVIEEVP